jgi:hypothetical protein
MPLRCVSVVSLPASICNLPHHPGTGCIKCNGLVTAELAGRLTSPIVRAEQSADSIGPKNTVPDTCGACEGSVAQHEVLRYHEGAQLPSPSVQEAEKDAYRAGLSEKDHVVPEPGKEEPFYGTEWAGRTGEFKRTKATGQWDVLASVLTSCFAFCSCVTMSQLPTAPRFLDSPSATSDMATTLHPM